MFEDLEKVASWDALTPRQPSVTEPLSHDELDAFLEAIGDLVDLTGAVWDRSLAKGRRSRVDDRIGSAASQGRLSPPETCSVGARCRAAVLQWAREALLPEASS